MQISRRDFIHAGCGIAAASLIPNPVEAWFKGSAVGNLNRSVINILAAVDTPFANLAKSMGFITPPSIADANGYPTTTPASTFSANVGMPGGYFGTFDWAWTGQGSMQISSSPPIIISNGGTLFTINSVSFPTNSGDSAGGNVGLINQTAPHVTFLFGINIQSISNNGSGLIRIGTKTGFATNLSTGATVNVQGAASNTNANGTWTITVIDAQTFDLQNSTFANTGGVQGQAVLKASNLTIQILNTGTFSGFTGLIWCKTSLYSAITTSGQIWDPTYISQLQSLLNQSGVPFANRGWLRFMDCSGVQNSLECDFANRMPSSYISYINNGGNYFSPNYFLSGGIGSSGGGATYVCNSGRTGAYQDLEIVQGTVDVTNTSTNPTLNDNSRGAVPIFDFSIHPYFIDIVSAPAAGNVGTAMHWTFSASWLNGGSAYTFSYTIQAGDVGNLQTFSANIYNAMVADATLSGASVYFANALNNSADSLIFCYPRNGRAGLITISYASGPAGLSKTYRLPASWLPNNALGTFIYSADLGGFIFTGTGLIVSIPIEAIINLCNQVGAHCWYTMPVTTKAQYITDFTNFMGDSTNGLTSGLRFGIEIGNEIWNASLGVWGKAAAFGTGIGCGAPPDSLKPQYSWCMNRLMQYRALAYAAWTGKSRSASDFYTLFMGSQSQAGPSQNFDTNGLQAALLNSSTNTIYATYGGLSGGLAAQNWSSSSRASAYTGDFGGRPCDGNVTATGMAMYWFSDYIGEVAGELTGTVTENSVWLQAALDYANGLTSTAFSELVTVFTTHRGSAPVSSGTYNNSTGQVVLTLASTINWGTLTQGDIVVPIGLTGTGALSSINGNGFTSVATTSGTTVTFNATSGLGTITITGGTLVDRTAAGLNPGQSGSLTSFIQFYAPGFESVCAQYDTSRAGKGAGKMGILHYEGAPQWSFNNNLTNGTNSVNDSTSLTQLQNQITSLSWNVSAFTKSGTNSASEMAQMILNLCQGWKLDLAGLSPSSAGSAANTGSYKNFIKTNYYQAQVNASAASGRETRSAQYGYENNTWGFFPALFGQGGQYQNFNAMQEFNAGG